MTNSLTDLRSAKRRPALDSEDGESSCRALSTHRSGSLDWNAPIPVPTHLVGHAGRSEHSALAEALREVKPRVRELLGISDTVIVFLELLVIGVRRLLDDSDALPWEQRLGDLLPESVHESTAKHAIDELQTISKDGIDRWLRRVSTPQGRLFLRRLIGAAAYDRLEAALRSDGALLVIAFRRLTRKLAPIAVALDEATAFLSLDQLTKETGGLGLLERSALNIVYQIDAQLDRLLDLDLPLADVPMREDEARSYRVDVEALAAQIRPLVSGESQISTRPSEMPPLPPVEARASSSGLCLLKPPAPKGAGFPCP